MDQPWRADIRSGKHEYGLNDAQGVGAEPTLHISALQLHLAQVIALQWCAIPIDASLPYSYGSPVALGLYHKDAGRPYDNVVNISAVETNSVEDMKLWRQLGQKSANIVLSARTNIVAISKRLETENTTEAPEPQSNHGASDAEPKGMIDRCSQIEEQIRENPHQEHGNQGPNH
jgi:hypothetical protein